MLNALWRRAGENPAFPGSEGVGQECAQQFDCTRAWRALTGTIQQMPGPEIDGIIAVNLKGFISLVDNLPEQCVAKDMRVQLGNKDCYGGIWLNAPQRDSRRRLPHVAAGADRGRHPQGLPLLRQRDGARLLPITP